MVHLTFGAAFVQVSEFLLNEYTHINNKPQNHDEVPHRISLKSIVKGLIFAMRLSGETAARTNSGQAKSGSRESSIFPYGCDLARQDEVVALLRKCGSWDFDVFELRDLTEGKELQYLAWYIFDRWNLVEKFNINPEVGFLDHCGWCKIASRRGCICLRAMD